MFWQKTLVTVTKTCNVNNYVYEFFLPFTWHSKTKSITDSYSWYPLQSITYSTSLITFMKNYSWDMTLPESAVGGTMYMYTYDFHAPVLPDVRGYWFLKISKDSFPKCSKAKARTARLYETSLSSPSILLDRRISSKEVNNPTSKKQLSYFLPKGPSCKEALLPRQ